VGEQPVVREVPRIGGTLVLLHAAGLDQSVWRAFEDAVQLPGWDVVALDLIGHGTARNAARDSRHGNLLQDITDEIESQLETFADPIVVLGTSVGGVIAQMLAIRKASGIRGLILCGTLFEPSQSARDALQARAHQTRALGAQGMVEETVARWFPPAFHDEQDATMNQIRDVLARADTETLAQIWEALASLGLRQSIPGIKQPSLVLCGSEDQAAPPSVSRELAGLLPHGRYQEIAGAGHLVPIERPSEVASAVSLFIACERF
jgi:pimeloyl-ACP methyl ester carboxylesterase